MDVSMFVFATFVKFRNNNYRRMCVCIRVQLSEIKKNTHCFQK